MSKVGKRLNKAASLVEAGRLYGLVEALDLLLGLYKEQFCTKFDETIDMVFNLGVDTKHSDQMVRGSVSMPSGLGKSVKVAIFTTEANFERAKASGADIVGEEALIESVKSGNINFDMCVATPDVMVKLAPLGRVLGPKGMMPNPKLGTVSMDIEGMIKRVKSGYVEYKADKFGIVHAGIAKLSFSVDAIKKNVMALYSAILASKPSGAKGIYIKSAYIGSSQGISVPLDISSLSV
ncbi:50S ribosomal protein L1 [Candidatus Cyrtobacter comes]|uniref:50S ribosomal protein L1 n=1 Tax=Candidatus Cyrtobacter comes TaxID=675776 RepID=UPI002ACDAFDB|nr:50S ribosomal protein L1 [Candidatus Cyrtobacter comes]